MSEKEPLIWKFIYPAVAVAGLMFSFWLITPGAGGGPRIGDPAPGFRLTDLGGRPVDLKDYRGKVVLIDFWATWCVTCIDELPALKALYEKYKGDNFELLAISVDVGGPGIVANFAAKHKLSYPIAFVDDKIREDYRVLNLPSKFLVNSSGLLHRRYPGQTDLKKVGTEIEKLLSKG